jgi:DNA topoisomerase-1
LGDAEGGEKPKRASLPKGTDMASFDLARALGLLSLPREIGKHPDTGEVILAGIGRFGPYIKHQSQYVSLRDDDVLTIGQNRAVTLLAETPKKAGGREVGSHPADGKPITVRAGRFGPYVQHGKLMATLPKGTDADTLSIERAIEILAAKAEKSGGKPAGGRKGKAPPKANGATAAKTAKPKAAKAKTAKPKASKAATTKRKPAAKGKAAKPAAASGD